jgi:hypothetical protein
MSRKSDTPKFTIEGGSSGEKELCKLTIPKTAPVDLGAVLTKLFSMAAKGGMKIKGIGGTLSCGINGAIGTYKMSVPRSTPDDLTEVLNGQLEAAQSAGITINAIKGTLTCY